MSLLIWSKGPLHLKTDEEDSLFKFGSQNQMVNAYLLDSKMRKDRKTHRSAIRESSTSHLRVKVNKILKMKMIPLNNLRKSTLSTSKLAH